MKIRMMGNSLRLRLSQSEITAIREGRKVIEGVRFNASQLLEYVLSPTSETDISASFENHTITVLVPVSQLREWAASELVGLAAEQQLDNNEALSILIEKDFQCLTPREEEDESDLFPNPGERC